MFVVATNDNYASVAETRAMYQAVKTKGKRLEVLTGDFDGLHGWELLRSPATGEQFGPVAAKVAAFLVQDDAADALQLGPLAVAKVLEVVVDDAHRRDPTPHATPGAAPSESGGEHHLTHRGISREPRALEPDEADFVGSVACPWCSLGRPRCPPSPGSKGRADRPTRQQELAP